MLTAVKKARGAADPSDSEEAGGAFFTRLCSLMGEKVCLRVSLVSDGAGRCYADGAKEGGGGILPIPASKREGI